MKKMDARKISATEQQYKRNKAIEFKKNGIHNLEIAEELGVHPNTISNWWSMYNKEGNILMKKPGRREGVNRTINTKQIIKQIINKTPKTLKLREDELWTRKAIKIWLKHISTTAVNNYLNDCKFAAKFPCETSFINNKKEEEKYEMIGQECEEKKGEIHWIEKKTYGIEHDEKKININMIFSVSKKTKLQFMLYQENFDDMIFIEFLNRLINSTNNKICLILNNLNVDTEIVNDWLEKHQTKIVLYYFTRYKTSILTAKTNFNAPSLTPKMNSQPTLF